MNNLSCPRIVVAALRGGAGKTLLSLGIAAALKKRGQKIAAFKKGPDYIDAAWLSLAAQEPCHNLDFFLMGKEAVQHSFWTKSSAADFSIVEGNRGLFDGMDKEGSQSTAELAKLIESPVILIVEGDKITRTAAALVLGCQKLDPKVEIKGVILNRIARPRHEEIIRQAITNICQLPVLGAIPRLKNFPLPERHLGLIPPPEHTFVEEALKKAEEIVEENVDLKQIWEIAHSAPPRSAEILEKGKEPNYSNFRKNSIKFKIGVIKDSAFQFYYPENIATLQEKGATIIELSPIKKDYLANLDALYIGGGFPETNAELLANNISFRNSLRLAIEKGLPVYAECGGLIFLGQSLTIGTKDYPMVGALPIAFAMEKDPQGHGYTILEVKRENPFFPKGLILRGHEFHYSRVLWFKEGSAYLAMQMKRGLGIDGQKDGFCYRNILAMFSHIHAAGCPEWAEGLVRKAINYRRQKENLWGSWQEVEALSPL